MFGITRKLALVLAVPVALGGGYAGWKLLGGGEIRPPAPQGLMAVVAEEALADLGARVAFDASIKQVIFPDLPGDPTGHLSLRLREILEQRQMFKVQPIRLEDEARAGVGGRLQELAADVLNRALEPEKARELAKLKQVDGTLRGQVFERIDDQEQAALGLRLSLVDLEGQERWALETRRTEPKRLTSLPYFRLWMGAWSLPGRMVSWLIFCVVLPLVLSPLVKSVLRRERNGSTAALLAALAALDTALAAALAGLPAPAFLTALAFVAVFAVAAGLSYVVVSTVHEVLA